MKDTKYFVGIRFDGTGKSYYFSSVFEDLKPGDLVVVETVSGVELGHVSTNLMDQANYKSDMELKPILRKADENDLADFEFNLEEGKKALVIANAEIKRLGLEMDLLDANYTLDGSKVTITFVADGRVDFRELVRILASRLHCRIELRQIVARDRAKMIGGLGTCGLPLCCTTFLNSFESVSITRAKNQMLTLNIPKLSGACGKLMCCLLFEDDMYSKAKSEFPRIGTVVHTDEGDFSVASFNILSRQIKLVGPENATKTLDLEEVTDLMRGIKRQKPKPVQEEVSYASLLFGDKTPEREERENGNGNNGDRNSNRDGGNNRNHNRHHNNRNRNNNNDNRNNQNRQNNNNNRGGNRNNNPNNSGNNPNNGGNNNGNGQGHRHNRNRHRHHHNNNQSGGQNQ